MNETKSIPLTETRACGCASDCCSTDAKDTSVPDGRGIRFAEGSDVRSVVREKYGKVAEGAAPTASGCCGVVDADAVLTEIGYTAEQAAAIPEGANLGLGCGNPIPHAKLRAGEVVLDLGSGGGIDCFLAAAEIGPEGRAIGVDMTPSMVERARATAARVGTKNVEFRLGEIEHLPVADASVDCIISNCVVNLSPEKEQVFAEAYRVLKPGGRLVISDLVLTRPLTPELRHDVALYVGCVAGASLKDEYLGLIRQAGFTSLEVLSETGYEIGIETLGPDSAEREAFRSVVSLKVRATRP